MFTIYYLLRDILSKVKNNQKEKTMDIEITQNIVLITLGTMLFFMYVTAKAFESISKDMDAEKNSK